MAVSYFGELIIIYYIRQEICPVVEFDELGNIYVLEIGEYKMKNLIFINGTMGVGKTAISRELQNFYKIVSIWMVIGVGTCLLLL